MVMLKRVRRIKGSVRKWVDYDRLSDNATGLKKVFLKLIVPAAPKHHESFESAVVRLKLTPADIQKRMSSLKRLLVLMLVIAATIFIYTIYNLIKAHWIAVILSFILFILTLVVAFRYHFWHFQLQQRKLGATFREWLFFGLLKHNNKKNLEIKSDQ